MSVMQKRRVAKKQWRKCNARDKNTKRNMKEKTKKKPKKKVAKKKYRKK